MSDATFKSVMIPDCDFRFVIAKSVAKPAVIFASRISASARSTAFAVTTPAVAVIEVPIETSPL